MTVRIQLFLLPREKNLTGVLFLMMPTGSIGQVLTQLYRNYPSTRKLAKRLGVSHTAIANKLREYGLSQKKNEE